MIKRRRETSEMKESKSYLSGVLNTGIANIVGVSMIGATANTVAGLPAGMARDIAGITPGLQSVALLGPNLKLVKTSLGSKKKGGFL